MVKTISNGRFENRDVATVLFLITRSLLAKTRFGSWLPLLSDSTSAAQATPITRIFCYLSALFSIEETIPCNCSEWHNNKQIHFYKYGVLRWHLPKARSEVICDRSTENVEIAALITDIDIIYYKTRFA